MKKNVACSLFVNDFVSCNEVNVYTAAFFIFIQCKMFIIKCVIFQMRWVGNVAREGERCILGFSRET